MSKKIGEVVGEWDLEPSGGESGGGQGCHVKIKISFVI